VKHQVACSRIDSCNYMCIHSCNRCVKYKHTATHAIWFHSGIAAGSNSIQALSAAQTAASTIARTWVLRPQQATLERHKSTLTTAVKSKLHYSKLLAADMQILWRRWHIPSCSRPLSPSAPRVTKRQKSPFILHIIILHPVACMLVAFSILRLQAHMEQTDRQTDRQVEACNV